ncbi:MAG: acyl-CoA dehydratase activase [Planctomycetes bacterium]|nr:acyl-CoA dehydratase activase [Planctomycetota bacterium]
MRLVAGIDVGTRATKAVLLDAADRARVGRALLPTGADLPGAAWRALEAALREAGFGREEVAYVAATGYGRYQVPFRDLQITEITCHARGAKALFPSARCVLDVGAMNSRAMRVAPSGRVEAFRMNDRCASGAGRFLERVARSLEVELEAVGDLSLRSQDPQPISSVCAVLAESEVINHVTEGRKIEDILRGAHQSIAERVVALLRQVGAAPTFALTGGLAKNAGMVRAIEERLGSALSVAPDAEYAGALGAAIFGAERLARREAPSPLRG